MNKNMIDLEDKYKVNADGCVIIARYDDDITLGQLMDVIIPRYKKKHPNAYIVFDCDMREVQDRANSMQAGLEALFG